MSRVDFEIMEGERERRITALEAVLEAARPLACMELLDLRCDPVDTHQLAEAIRAADATRKEEG